MADIKKLDSHYTQLKNQRDKWEPIWKDAQKLILPYHGRFEEINSGQADIADNDERIDDTATLALRVLASGMQGGLTNPSQRWFRLGLGNTELGNLKSVRLWLDEVERIMLSHFRKSNFYQATNSIYKEIGGFGTACLFEEEAKGGKGLRFHVVTIGDYVLAPNSVGRIDTVYRRDFMTADQIVEMFGEENVSDGIKRVLKSAPFTYFEVMHCVRPRKERDTTKIDANNMPFESVYWEKGQSKALKEGGFNDNPYMSPRWFVSGSMVYGVGPGLDGMPTIRGSNVIKEDLFEAVEKEVHPPVNIPESLWGSVDLDARGENPVSGSEHVTETYQISPNLAAGLELSAEEKQTVRDWFFTNLFILATNPNATATEIVKKAQEQLIQLGPVLQGLFDELLTPVVERSFNILFSQGEIPPAPPELEGQELEIEFISPLAEAQKRVTVDNNDRFIAGVLQVSASVPTALDNVDIDEYIRSNAENTGVQSKIIRGRPEMAQIRQIRQQAQQMQGAQDAMEQSSRTADNLGRVKLDEDNAAARMAEAQEQ